MSPKLRIKFITNSKIIPDDFTGYYTRIDGHKVYYLDGYRVSRKTYELVLPPTILEKNQPGEVSTVSVVENIEDKSLALPTGENCQVISPRVKTVNFQESSCIGSTKKLCDTKTRKTKLVLNFDTFDNTETYEDIEIQIRHECQKHGIKRSSNNQFKISLKKLGLEPNIISKAVKIKSQLTTGRKKNSKLYLIFFCVYYASYECGVHSPPQEVAQLVGLNNNKINKAFSTYMLSQNSYKPPKIEQTPINFLRRFCLKTNLNSDDQKEVNKIIERIKIKNMKILNEWFPQNFCLAAIFYYCDIRGVKLDKEKYSKELVKVTWATLKAIVDKISSIDNS